MNLHWIDITIIFVWLTLILGAGILAGLRTNFEGFWAGKRSASSWPLIFSVVATQVGAGVIAGIASATWKGGTGFGLVCLVSTVVGFLLVAKFAPLLKRFGDEYRAYTLPQIFAVRYGRRAQIAASVVVLITYLGILSAQFLAISGLLSLSTNLDFRLAIIFAAICVVIYSAIAGMPGDIVTDIWHFIGMTIGLFFILLPAMEWHHPTATWIFEVPGRIWNPLTFGGSAFVFIGLIAGGIVPLLMPELWMKVYASRTAREARWMMIAAAIGVIPFYLFAMYLGLSGHVTEKELSNSDLLVFVQMAKTLPKCLLGIAIATFLSVILSTANSLMLVVSATMVGDVLRKEAESDASLWLSRSLTAAAGILSIILAFVIPNIVQLLLGAFYMLGVLAPALVGVLLWKRATHAGAFWSIIAGTTATIAGLLIIPTVAFLPGVVVSVIVFAVVSVFTQHENSEKPALAEGLASETHNARS